MSSYDRVLNSLKKIDTSYNPTMKKIQKPVIGGNYKVTVNKKSHSNRGTLR